MLIIFSQVLILLIFVAIGFILGKTNIVKSEHSKILSSLLVYVFLPCNIFKSFSTNFTIGYITGGYKLILASVAIIIILSIFAYFSAKLFSKDKYERYIYEYSLMVPNYGYIGYALAEALLGETGLINIMTFAIPVSLYIYTFAFSKLTKRGFSFKKLCNPTIFATVLGIIFGLCDITVPDVFLSVISKASSCMAPVSMLLTGIVISGFSLKSIINNAKIYFLTIARLILIPLLIGFALSLFCETSIVQTAVLFYALPCGMNTVVFPRLVDENCKIGAGLAIVSTILACITLPIILSIFNVGG